MRTQIVSWGLRTNLWLLSITKHWLRAAIAFWLIWGTLPWIAPVLMKLGATGPATAIYQMYQPMCHRFAFRSFYLFGEQAAYPLAGAHSGLVPFEALAGVSPLPGIMRAGKLPTPPFGIRALPQIDGIWLNGAYAAIDIPDDVTPYDTESAANFARLQLASSSFIGNEQFGYKAAVCERDVSIYAGLGLTALIFAIPRVRRKLRPLPIWMYVLIGLVPIGLDGFSQMFGYAPFSFWPPRETIPAFRVITGLVFGLATGWLGYPNIDLSMRETREAIELKLARRRTPPA